MYRRSMIAVALCLVLGAAMAQAEVTLPPFAPNGLAVLFTDYGADSLYVGMLKGAMYTKSDSVRIDMLTNSVPPFDVLSASYMLADGCKAYPRGTVFVCVVDPGVGTDRKCLVIRTEADQVFVAPDNGLLTMVAWTYNVAEMRECTNQDLWLDKKNVSTTFHGRDIMGPVGAALATGTTLDKVGDPMGRMTYLKVEPSAVEDGVAHGEVMRIDDYGNVVTNIRGKHLELLGLADGDTAEVKIGDAQYTCTVGKTYGAVPEGDRVVLVQSGDFVECAINQGNLAKAIDAKIHAPVTIKKQAAAAE